MNDVIRQMVAMVVTDRDGCCNSASGVAEDIQTAIVEGVRAGLTDDAVRTNSDWGDAQCVLASLVRDEVATQFRDYAVSSVAGLFDFLDEEK